MSIRNCRRRFIDLRYVIYRLRVELKRGYLVSFALTLLLTLKARSLLRIRPPDVTETGTVVLLSPPLGVGDVVMLSSIVRKIAESGPVTVLSMQQNFLDFEGEWLQFSSVSALYTKASELARNGRLLYIPEFNIGNPGFLLRNLGAPIVAALSLRIGIDTVHGKMILVQRDATYRRRAFELLKEFHPLGSGVLPQRIPVRADKRSDLLPDENEKFFVVAPFSAWESRRWPPERWAELLDRLASDYGAGFIFIGGEAERVVADEIAGLVSGSTRCLNLMGRTELTNLPELFRRSSGFLTVDNGLMHVGMSMGVKTVALFGPTPASERIDGCAGVVAVQSYSSCALAPCYTGYAKVVCPFGHECIRDIAVESVVEAFKTI